MVSNSNKVRIMLMGIIISMIFLSIGCLQNGSLNDKQSLNEIYNETIEKIAEKEVDSITHGEIKGPDLYSTGTKYYESKQYSKAENSFKNAETEFTIASTDALLVRELWSGWYREIENGDAKFADGVKEDFKNYLKYKYWIADSKSKQYESMSKHCQYLSNAMGYIDKGDSNLTRKYLDLAEAERLNLNSLIDIRNEYARKLIEFEEKLGWRPSKPI